MVSESALDFLFTHNSIELFTHKHTHHHRCHQLTHDRRDYSLLNLKQLVHSKYGDPRLLKPSLRIRILPLKILYYSLGKGIYIT